LDLRRLWAKWQVPRSVVAVALVASIVELVMAGWTGGTNDISHWTDFVNAVRKHGPIGIYGAHIATSYYNHPPLMGYVLIGIDALRHMGLPIRFTIRALSSVADFVVVLVVYALIRRRRGQREATWAGILLACSPVLFAISGYHGNTDPDFSMLVLLSVYLLADREKAGWAGAVIAIAIGVKLVAIVAAPALFVYALTRGRKSFLAFSAAAAAVLAITWGPAVALEWRHVKTQVIDYPGLGMAQWGLTQFGHWAGNPVWVGWARGSGRTFIAMFCAAVPAIAVLLRPRAVATAVALSLCGFLALSPEFAVQYLAWAAAATFVISLWGGIAYNFFAGWLLVLVYNQWGHALFATNRTLVHYHPLTVHQTVFALLAWAAVVCTCWSGLRSIAIGRDLPSKRPSGVTRTEAYRKRVSGQVPNGVPAIAPGRSDLSLDG
jgi:4-amino-4-deoxy-L-arabinose transferase-like glycosyltransferase